MASADGSIVISVDADDKDAQKKLDSITKKIERLNDEIYKKQQQRMPLAEQAEKLGVQLDAAKAKLYEMENGYSASTDEIKEQKETVKSIQAQWDKAIKKVESIDSSIEKTNVDLDIEKEKAGEVQRQMAGAYKSAAGMPEAINLANDRMSKLANRVAGLAKRVFVFTLITKALRSMRSWMWKAIQTSDEAKAALGQLKGALLTLAQPIIEVVIPAFTMLVNILTRVVTVIANLVSAVFGKSAKQSAESAKNLYDEMNAIEGVGEAAETATQQLAGFDEINTISSDTSSSASSGVSTSGIAADFSAFDQFDTEEYKRKIDELTVYVSGALLALGVILTFSGANIPLGLGLMAAGALGLAAEIRENWSAMDSPVKDAINRVLLILGGAGLVIGAVLAFSGANIPLGIGLMAMGAASLATAAALNWGQLSGEVQRQILNILIATGEFLIVLGLILALSGANIPLGIGLMIAGAAAIAAAAALDWDYVSTKIRTIITELLVMVGIALLALGAILTFSGANLPLGIGLMIAGAVSLAAAVALNWDFVVNKVRGICTELLVIAGAAALVIGLILVCSGVALPLGIGLMASGATALGTAVALNWNYITDKIREILNNIRTMYTDFFGHVQRGINELEQFINTFLSNLDEKTGGKFHNIIQTAQNYVSELCGNVKEYFNGVVNFLNGVFSGDWDKAWSGIVQSFKGEWNAIISYVEGAINIIISGLNSLISKMNSIKFDVPDWVPVIGGKSLSPSIRTISTLSIPRLAAGAVIPPNREFAAVLGDQTNGNNLEAPEDLIRQIVREESGSSEMVSLLQAILEATKAGHVMKVDKKVLARTAADGINDITLSSGKPAIVF